ncbi:MAG TPA: PAC2 family protein [Chloroflexota bacterium]|nr:PAC2 family protein [Chloroflexota bacterium]
MASRLMLKGPLDLRRPTIIAAFTGWPDAAEAASRAVDFMRVALDARAAGRIAGDDFYDLSSTRPVVTVRRGLARSMRYPTTTIHASRSLDDPEHDLLLLSGPEPNLRWREYIETVLELAAQCDARMVYSLGSMFAAVPHTRPVRIAMAAAQVETRRQLERLGTSPISYEGPGSLHTAILDTCRRRHVPAATLWGQAPAYAQLNWSPRVSLALVETVRDATGLPLDLSLLRAKAAQVDNLLDRLVQGDEDVRRTVQVYEQRYDGEPPTPSSLPSAEAIVNEVEAFLRGDQRDREPEDL